LGCRICVVIQPEGQRREPHYPRYLRGIENIECGIVDPLGGFFEENTNQEWMAVFRSKLD
jgi:hypothetical protein